MGTQFDDKAESIYDPPKQEPEEIVQIRREYEAKIAELEAKLRNTEQAYTERIKGLRALIKPRGAKRRESSIAPFVINEVAKAHPCYKCWVDDKTITCSDINIIMQPRDDFLPSLILPAEAPNPDPDPNRGETPPLRLRNDNGSICKLGEPKPYATLSRNPGFRSALPTGIGQKFTVLFVECMYHGYYTLKSPLLAPRALLYFQTPTDALEQWVQRVEAAKRHPSYPYSGIANLGACWLERRRELADNLSEAVICMPFINLCHETDDLSRVEGFGYSNKIRQSCFKEYSHHYFGSDSHPE